MTKELTLDHRLDRIDDQLERIAKVVATGFETARQDQESVRAEVRQAIDIYARAVDAYAKQAKTHMQEMLALSTEG